MARFKTSYVSTILLSAALVHCGRDKSPEPAATAPPPAEPVTMTPPPQQEQQMTPAAGTTEPAPATAPAPAEAAAPALSDEEIFKLLDVANTAEVEQGKLAQTKARSAKVKNFAALMIQHHTKAKEKGSKLSAKLGITPAETAMATQMKSEADSKLMNLKNTSGQDFDRAYMDLQVEEHQKLLTKIDEKLMPSAKDPQLKALLQELRTTVESHLKEAQKIQGELSAAQQKG